MLILTGRLPPFVHHHSAIRVVHSETLETAIIAGRTWTALQPDLSGYTESEQNQLRSGFRRHCKTGRLYYALQLSYWNDEDGASLGMFYRALYHPPDNRRYRFRPLKTNDGAGWLDLICLDGYQNVYRFEWI